METVLLVIIKVYINYRNIGEVICNMANQVGLALIKIDLLKLKQERNENRIM